MNTSDPLLRTSRVTLLQETFRGQFQEEFDMASFRRDHFYAAQILERALRDGSPELRALAAPMEHALLTSLDVEVVDLDAIDTVGWADEFGGSLAQSATPPSVAQAVSETTAAPAVVPLPSANPAAAPAEKTAEERRRDNPLAGHVRLNERETLLLSQLRIQYRKTFGMFFDILEFTGNDLYARTLLKICLASDNPYLVLLAREFVGENESPRLHRRKGVADLEFTIH